MFEGDSDTLPLFTIQNKWSLGGPRMIANLTNFDDKPVKLHVRGKLLNSNGKIVLDDQPVAKFERGILEPMAGQPDRLETVSKMTLAPLGTPILPACSNTIPYSAALSVDVAMAASIFVCLHDISNED